MLFIYLFIYLMMMMMMKLPESHKLKMVG